MPVKPGWTTSEWWTQLAAHVIAVVALVHPGFTVDPQWTAAFVALASELGAGLYAHSRGTVKAAASLTTAPAPTTTSAPVASTADASAAAQLRALAATLDPTA